MLNSHLHLEERDVEALWNALNSGLIDIVASDHAPHTREEKDHGFDDIWNSPPGLPGIETMLALMLTKVNSGLMSISRLVEALSENPAKIFGFYPRKGIIRVGSDADLTIVDLNLSYKISGAELHSKIDWTPFEGVEIKGLPVMSIVRGMVVMKDGEIVSSEGHGTFIPVYNNGLLDLQ
jgi:dihydroorotase-like cyclic amidohydrolase